MIKTKRYRMAEGLAFLGLLSIPSGLISWLFWPHGWKVAVAGLIVFAFLVFMLTMVEYGKRGGDMR